MIIIMSDSHGESEAIENIKTKYQHDASFNHTLWGLRILCLR